METLKLLLAACAMLVWAGNAFAQSGEASSAKGVTIQGITWAESNVGLKGKFMDNPSDYGRYYTFDEAQEVCPKGWRLPNIEELEMLTGTTHQWTDKNGVQGQEFGIGENTVFLPATGARTYATGALAGVGCGGHYWSGTPGSAANGCNLGFSAGTVNPSLNANRAYGFAARCVSE